MTLVIGIAPVQEGKRKRNIESEKRRGEKGMAQDGGES